MYVLSYHFTRSPPPPLTILPSSYVNVIATLRQIFEAVEPTQTDRDYLQHNLSPDDDRDVWEPPSRMSPSPAAGEPSTYVDLMMLRYRISCVLGVHYTLDVRVGVRSH